jgi:hypothetical protein
MRRREWTNRRIGMLLGVCAGLLYVASIFIVLGHG